MYMVYAVLKMSHNNQIYLERFSDEAWEHASPVLNEKKGKVIYVTKDIDDEELKAYKEIVWMRFYSPVSKANIKIIIPFTPDDIPFMEEKAEEIVKEKQQKIEKQLQDIKDYRIQKKENDPRILENARQHAEQVSEQDELIPMDMDEFQAMIKWRESGFIMPPARRILELKKSYNKSWEQFERLCNHIM